MTIDDKNYWRNFVLAGIVIAAGTALVNEGAKVLAEALRKRWHLDDDDEPEPPSASTKKA